MIKIAALALLVASPVYAQNTGTVQQPGSVNRTGTIQQPTVALQAPAHGAPAPAVRAPSTAARGGTADSAAQPSGMEFHQMMPVK